MKYKVRVILFLLLLVVGFTAHFLKKGQVLPHNLHKIVELIRER